MQVTTCESAPVYVLIQEKTSQAAQQTQYSKQSLTDTQKIKLTQYIEELLSSMEQRTSKSFMTPLKKEEYVKEMTKHLDFTYSSLAHRQINMNQRQ